MSDLIMKWAFLTGVCSLWLVPLIIWHTENRRELKIKKSKQQHPTNRKATK